MRLDQLNYFVEVSRCSSFSLAASRLFMSQQNISTGIRKLETELGFALFKRTPHGVVLTPQGQEVLVHAEEILRKVEDIRKVDQAGKEQLTGELRVELVPYIALPEMIVDFYKHNPAVAIKTTEKSPAEIIANVQDGFADVGFIYLREGEDLESLGLIHEMLSRDQLYVCVSKKLKYPTRSYSVGELFDKELPLIVFNSLYEWTLETLDMLDEPRPLVYRADTQLYMKMILEGLAAGFSTKTGIEQEVIFKKDEVDTIKIAGVYLEVCMLYKKDPSSSLKEGFLQVVREKFRGISTDESTLRPDHPDKNTRESFARS